MSGLQSVKGYWGSWRVALTAGLAIGVLSLGVPSAVAGAAPVVTPLAVAGNGYLATGANGDVYVPYWESGILYQVTPDGTVSDFANFPGTGVGEPWAMTSDAQGNIYVDLYISGVIEKVTPSGTVSVYASSPDLEDGYGMTFGPNGVLYLLQDSGNLYQVASNGTVTYETSGAGDAGLAANAQGTLFSGTSGSVIDAIAPGGSVSTFATIPGAAIEDVVVGPSGDVYAADSTSGNIYRVTPNGAVTVAVSASQLGSQDAGLRALAFDSAGDLFAFAETTAQIWRISGVDSAPAPLNLVVSETQGMITGSWYGPSGLSYTCTLMYGFNDPSSTTTVVTTPSCTFEGLDTTMAYGIEVAATNGYGASAVAFGTAVPAVVKAPPVKHTIVCKKNRKTAIRTVTGLHPTCPAGWHRVA